MVSDDTRRPFFYGDMTVPGMLYAKLIRTPVGAGIVRSITQKDGNPLPENMYLYTAKDIPGANRVVTLGTETPVFARDSLSFEGEPVGILAGEDCDDVERVSSLLSVEVDAVPNSEGNAMRKILERTVGGGTAGASEEFPDGELLAVDGTYSVALSGGILSETAGCVASFTDGRLAVCCPAEWAGHLRENLSAVLGVPEENIDIVKSRAASQGSTDLWYGTVIACQAGLAAMLSGRAVKLVFSRAEHARFLENPMSCVVTHRSLVAHNGEIVSMDIEILADVGRGNPFAREILDRLTVCASGIYRPRRLSIKAGVSASAMPPANVSLFGVARHCFFAVENHIGDIVSRTDGFPPDVRKLNGAECTARKNGLPFDFDLKTGGAVLDAAVSMSDFSRKYGAYELQSEKRGGGGRQSSSEPIRGIGMASAFAPGAFHGTMFSSDGTGEELELTLEKNGTVTIGAHRQSRSIRSIWTSIVAKSLDIDAGQISFQDDFEPGREPLLPARMYANVSVMTDLLKQCCEAVQEARFREPLPIRIRRAASDAERRVWDGELFRGQPFRGTAPVAAVVEIELEPFTLHETVRGIWIALDGGEILDAKRAEASVRQSVQDVLSSLAPHDAVDPGRITVSFLHSTEEPRQIGEAVYAALPAAYAAALSQGASFPIRTLPVEFDTMFRLVTERPESSGDGRTSEGDAG
jgi:CO/xanthine dehydrogenase Mo-binding subunit